MNTNLIINLLLALWFLLYGLANLIQIPYMGVVLVMIAIFLAALFVAKEIK